MDPKVNVRLSGKQIVTFLDMLESCYDLTDPENEEEAKLVTYLDKRLEAFYV
tara:strand:- start:5702 stop:5857 length:156 start_codon:yes stop_codon:yes gene_type:complete